MRVYRTDWDGVDVVRLAGVVGAEEAAILVERLGFSRNGSDWCCILDFSRVRHLDKRALGVFENLARRSCGVIFSGFNDYLLGIIAPEGEREALPVFPTWRKALSYLMAERGKLCVHAAAGEAGGA